MVKFLSKLILKLLGWKEVGSFPEGKKFVIVAAPHTSSWDFIIGHLYYNSIGKRVSYMIKGAYFFFPLGLILKALGAIPVYKNNRIGLGDQMIQEFAKHNEFLLTIAPEGTRKKVNRWKKGFYYIAQGAQVPIVLGTLNFENKTIGASGVFYPTGNMDADIKEIRSYYKKNMARHPELFSAE